MRLVLFSLSIGVIFISLTLSLISASQPHWIHQVAEEDLSGQVTSLYGLFAKCDQSLLDPTAWICRQFPKLEADCREPLADHHSSHMQASSRASEDLPTTSDGLLQDLIKSRAATKTKHQYSAFCSCWRLAGYFSQLSIAFGAAALLSLVVVVGGGRRRRRSGWPLCAGLVALHAAFQIATFAIVAHAWRTDSRFHRHATLGWCFYVSLVAWVLNVLLAVSLAGTGLAGQWEIPERRGYTPIPDHHDH